MNLAGKNIVVLDLETLHSADDCKHCGRPGDEHAVEIGMLCYTFETQYEKIGWDGKRALGISIGAYYSYADGNMHWFDASTVSAVVDTFLETKPLLVSFNGIGFDFPLMDAMLAFCSPFFIGLYQSSYDILAEIWKVKPNDKFKRGLNSLAALCKANHLQEKEMTGELAPRLWEQGRYAEVIAYNVGDVYRTKALFEMVCNGIPIIRGDGSAVILPPPYFGENYQGETV